MTKCPAYCKPITNAQPGIASSLNPTARIVMQIAATRQQEASAIAASNALVRQLAEISNFGLVEY